MYAFSIIILHFVFLGCFCVRRFTQEAPLSLHELKSLTGRHFKALEGSRQFGTVDPDCPSLFSSYRAESLQHQSTFGLKSVAPVESDIHQTECSGHFGGLEWVMEDKHLVFENGLIGRISMDQSILRVENDTETRSFLEMEQTKHRKWDTEVDEVFKRVKQGEQCKSENKFVGTYETSGLCAEAVLQQGYEFFIFAHYDSNSLHNEKIPERDCYIELTDSEYCREGWEPAAFDFYSIVPPLETELVQFIHETYAESMRAQGYEEEAVEAEEKLAHILHRRRTQRRSLQALAEENEEESGGRSAACGKSHKLEECLDTFSTGVSVILNVLGRAQTPVCKKSKDKRARSHPGCCGGKQAWYCLGICCKGGGALSCCGANFGWTLHPVVDRYCYADEGSYPYVDGSDVCPPNFHSCSVWMGQGGVACAADVGSCLIEKFKFLAHILEIVVNCVLLVLTFGEYAALETAAKTALETGTEAAIRAGGKSAARKAMMRAWKLAGIGFNAFKHVLWDELRELPQELAELLIEEAAVVMMANAAHEDGPSAADIAWDVAEVVDPTGVVALVNYMINGIEWCVYPEHFSPLDQKKLVLLTHQAEIIDRFSALYGAGTCGVIAGDALSEIDCASLGGNIVEGRLVKYLGEGPVDGPNGPLNNCGCNFVSYEPATATGLNQIYYGGKNCEIEGGSNAKENTPICEFTRDCSGDHYISYEGYECGEKIPRDVPPPILDNCLFQCDNSTKCTGFSVKTTNGDRHCYITEAECKLMHSDSASTTAFVRELCSQNKFLLDDAEGPQWCTAAQHMTQAECMGLHDQRLATDILVKWDFAFNDDVSKGTACGCSLALEGGKWLARYNTRQDHCDISNSGEISVCRKEKDRCYKIIPEENNPFSGPYIQKNTTADRPIFCRKDGNYTLHFSEHTSDWQLCPMFNSSCGYHKDCGSGFLGNGTVADSWLRPKTGPFMVIHGPTPMDLEEVDCRDVMRPEFSLSDYWASAPGMLCPTAVHVIRDQGECATALRQLNWNSLDFVDFLNPLFPHEGDAYPAGCSTLGGSHVPMFETSKVGRGKARTGVMQICKRPKYYMSTYEEGSCPNFASMIYDKNECRDALQILGKPIYFGKDAEGTPNGCSYDLGETAAYFTQSQAEDGMGKTKIGRAPICREVKCLTSMGNAKFKNSPWNSTQFETDVPNWASLCEEACLKSEQCSCFQMQKSTGICAMYMYFDCHNVDPVVKDPEDEHNENFAHGFCPHAGANGFIPIAKAACKCPILQATMPESSTYKDYECAKEIYKVRDEAWGIDDLFASTAFFMHYTRTADSPNKDVYSPEDNCLITFASDRSCATCSREDHIPNKYQIQLTGGLVDWHRPQQEPQRYVFYQMAGGFFDNFYVHECECEDYCHDEDDVGFTWCTLKGGLRAKRCPGAIMSTSRDSYISGALCDHDYPCECLGAGYGGSCRDWDETGFAWCYLKGGHRARHCPEAQWQYNLADKKDDSLWWSGAPCYERFCDCEGECSQHSDAFGSPAISTCPLYKFDTADQIEKSCRGAQEQGGGYVSGRNCGNGLTEIDYYIGQPGGECLPSMAILTRSECLWAMQLLKLKVGIVHDYENGYGHSPLGCSYEENKKEGMFNIGAGTFGHAPLLDFSPICKAQGRDHYYLSELNANCDSVDSMVLSKSECEFAMRELGIFKPITHRSYKEGTEPRGCSYRPTAETCEHPDCLKNPNEVFFLTSTDGKSAPAEDRQQVCKNLGCIPCKCKNFNKERGDYYQCSSVDNPAPYGPVSCYSNWQYRAYDPTCPGLGTYGCPIDDKWCADYKDQTDIDCDGTFDDCWRVGMLLCDGEPSCKGVMVNDYWTTNLKGVKFCMSERMEAKTDGWFTRMKGEVCDHHWVLLRSNTECKNNDNEYEFGTFDSVEKCAEACRSWNGCTNFIYGKGSKAGRCWDEGITQSDCTSWEDNEYDFYGLLRDGFPDTSPQSSNPDLGSSQLDADGTKKSSTSAQEIDSDTTVKLKGGELIPDSDAAEKLLAGEDVEAKSTTLSWLQNEVLSASLYIQILAFVGLISFAYGLCVFLFPGKEYQQLP